MADTIAAISTGNAPGGIGVIRISGDAAIETAAKVFAPADKSQLTELKGYRAKYGNIIIDGERADNAVALVFVRRGATPAKMLLNFPFTAACLWCKKRLRRY